MVHQDGQVFEFTADSSREPFYTDEERRRVRAERAIPPSTIILLGGYRGDGYQGFAQDRDLNVQSEGSSTYRRYVNVFSIGHLLMFAVSDGLREKMAELPWPDDQDLKETWVSIWPSYGPQTWPPTQIFGDERADQSFRRCLAELTARRNRTLRAMLVGMLREAARYLCGIQPMPGPTGP